MRVPVGVKVGIVALAVMGSYSGYANYIPQIVPHWNTVAWPSALSTSGFTANFATAPGVGGSTYDIIMVR